MHHQPPRPSPSLLARLTPRPAAALLAVVILGSTPAAIQTVHEAPASAPSSGRVAPAGEPGQPLSVSGIVVGADDKPIPGASLYVFPDRSRGLLRRQAGKRQPQPAAEALLRSDASGAWSFETIRPGSYPSSRVPGHIHFEVAAPGRAPLIFEIVFEGDPFITDEMRRNAAFSVQTD